MGTDDLFAALEAPPAAAKRRKKEKTRPALPPLGTGWYGPPPPVWLFQKPWHQAGDYYHVAHTAIADVTDDDDLGMCGLVLHKAPEPVLVAISAKTVRDRMPWLPSAVREREKAAEAARKKAEALERAEEVPA